MKFIVCAVRDIKANLYDRPFYAQSVGSAVRSFGDEVVREDPNNMLHKHPYDFELYQLGTYDDETGTFDCGTPKQLAVGSDYVVVVSKGKGE